MLAKNPAERPTMSQVEAALTQEEQQLAAGTSRSVGAVRRRARRTRQGTAAVLLVSVVLGGWQRARTRGPVGRGQAPAHADATARPAPPAAGPAAPARPSLPTVAWEIRTEPPGARVVRLSDQVLLGTTPWQTRAAQGDGEVAVALELAGFVPQRALLSQQKDAHWALTLQPLPPPGAPERPTRGRLHSGSRPPAAASLPAAAAAAPAPTPAAAAAVAPAAPPPEPRPEPAPPPAKKQPPPRDEDPDVPALH
jgi:hypothetical protein